MSTLAVTCPLDGLPLGLDVTLTIIGKAGDIDGNFARDATQHIHEIASGTRTCANGHHWRFTCDLVSERLER